jgi:hypothetical protein
MQSRSYKTDNPGRYPGKRFGNLLRGPFRSGMAGYVEVNGVTALVGHHNKRMA